MSSLIYWKCPVQVFFFFFPNSVFMIFFILFYFPFIFFLFFFFFSFLITFCKDGILTSGLLDKTKMVPIFTIPHNVTVTFSPPGASAERSVQAAALGACTLVSGAWSRRLRRGEIAASRGIGSLLVLGVLFIVEKMHWSKRLSRSIPCASRP